MQASHRTQATAILLLAAILLPGCAGPNAHLQYLVGDERSLSHYEDMATAIEYPVEHEQRQVDPNLFLPPRSIKDLADVKHRPMTLDECVRAALSRSAILRDDSSFGSPGNPLLGNPGRVASVYDSAIQETSFLFGNRGPEAALSDFDALFTQNMQWGRSEDPQNTGFFNLSPGDVLTDETAQWSSRIEKPFANSGTFSVQHDWNYSGNNVSSRLFPSAYTGFLQGEYRQPLLAGSGTEFTRIAGPLSQNLRGVSGVSQGVLISRINSDISLIDFEQSVATLVRDVENVYWDLYLALQLYDSEIETFKDLVRFWKRAEERRNDVTAANIAQAEARVYEADARIKGSLADVLEKETRLRRMMGLPLNDGDFITPADRPSEAKLAIDWEATLTEALAHRPELRRQKWEIRSLELQLAASKNLSRPRLDFVSQYRVNGFGDNLLGTNDDDGVTDAGYRSAYESLTQGDNTTWNLGFSFSMPVGLRLAKIQVRNYELRLVKSRTVLSEQEREIAYELNNSLLNMDRWYELADSSTKRLRSADENLQGLRPRLEGRQFDRDVTTMLSMVLEAQISRREAEQAYLRSIVEYNKSIVDLNYRKGMSLKTQSIFLAEGEWNPLAYEDARRRAVATTHALDNPHLKTEPLEITGGAAPNAWESTGSVDRPHVLSDVVNGPSAAPQSNAAPSMGPPSVPPAPAGRQKPGQLNQFELPDSVPAPDGQDTPGQPPAPEINPRPQIKPQPGTPDDRVTRHPIRANSASQPARADREPKEIVPRIQQVKGPERLIEPVSSPSLLKEMLKKNASSSTVSDKSWTAKPSEKPTATKPAVETRPTGRSTTPDTNAARPLGAKPAAVN